MADNLEHTQGGNNVVEDTGDGRITGQEQEIIDVVNDAIESGDIKVNGKDLYNLRLVLDFDPEEDYPCTRLGIDYNAFVTKEVFVEALNNALSSLAGEPVEVHTLMELRAFIAQLDTQGLTQAFLMIAMIGAGLPYANATYEVQHQGDAEPATFTNVFKAGYFGAEYVFFISANGVQNLAQNFMTNVGQKQVTLATIYCDALPSDVNVEE